MQPVSDAGDELNLREYVEVLRRRKLTVILTTSIIVAIVVAVSLLQTPRYRATAEVLLRERAAEQIFSPGQLGQAPVQARVNTEIQVMESRSVEEAVEAALGREADVSIAARGDTDVVAISSESTDAAAAAETANTYASVYVETRRQAQIDDLLGAAEQVQAKITQLDLELADLPEDDVRRTSLEDRRSTYAGQLDQLQLAGELTQTGGAQVVSEAEVPEVPVAPQPARNAALAGVLGLIFGLGLALLREHLDDSIKAIDDLERAVPSLTVLGLVPDIIDWKERSHATLVSIRTPHSPGAEAYRSLRTSLQFVGIDRPVAITQITSPSQGEGKTTTLSNLGVQLAGAGQRVVLVDCDLRRPRLHEFFSLDNTRGFTSVLLGETSIHEVVQSVPNEPNLRVIPSGPPPPNPSELLSSPRSADVLLAIAREADFVLVDSPPVLPVTDAAVLSRLADAVVLVVSAGSTSNKEVSRAVEILTQVNAPLVGAVLNGTDAAEGYTGYGSYVYSRHETQSPRARKRTEKRLKKDARRSRQARDVPTAAAGPAADRSEPTSSGSIF